MVTVRAETVYSALMKNLTADEMSMLAVKDSMYYHYDEWFSRLQGDINRDIPSVVGFRFA